MPLSKSEIPYPSNIRPLPLDNVDGYISDINELQLANTGFLHALESNRFFAEACQMLINSLNLYQQGYFDCAFYSLRQSLELSIGSIFLISNPEQLEAWKKCENGFESGQMAKYLRENEPNFKEVREKLSLYFEGLREYVKKINKYVHKQGYRSFYGCLGDGCNYSIEKKVREINGDFRLFLEKCIGAVAIYRFIVDPMAWVLADEDLLMRSGDYITEPFSQTFLDKYIGNEIFEILKTTQFYRDIADFLRQKQRQNSAVFQLIHYQGFDRKYFEEMLSQFDLISDIDKIAVSIFMCSSKISQLFLWGFYWYWSDVKSNRGMALCIGDLYYSKLFEHAVSSYNLPFDMAFLSRFKFADEYHYVEHNQPLSAQEIKEIESVLTLFEPPLIQQSSPPQ